MMKRFLPLLLVLCCVLTGCQKTTTVQTSAAAQETQPAEDAASTEVVIVTVNGEDLLYSDYVAIETAYLYQYESAGVDLTNEEIYTYLQDLALTYAIEQMLIRQDMQAQGCYDFDEETEAWFTETGKTTYEAALEDVKAAFRVSDPSLTEDEVVMYALTYALSLNVTEQTYVDYFRTQYASENYHQWLIKDNPITDADIEAAYAARVEESKALYENDVAAFETALNNGNEIWYRPAGYRSVLQILLPAEGETDEARLQSVQGTVDTIYMLLEQGESFQNLVTLYGADANFADSSFMETGYQVHADSVMWEDLFVATAFSADMVQPGCWSQPFVSTLGVHILYYLNDVPGGPISLTDDIATALTYVLYTERYSAAQTERLNELTAAAEIVFH